MPPFNRIQPRGLYKNGNAPLPPAPGKIKSPLGKEISDYIRKTLLDGQDNVEVLEEENIFTVDVDRISIDERKKLFNRLSEVIRYDFFGKFFPEHDNKYMSKYMGPEASKTNDIGKNTVYSYKAAEQKIILSDDDIKRFLTKEKHMQTLMLHSNVGYINNKDRIDSLNLEGKEEEIYNDFSSSVDELVNAYKVANMSGIEKAVDKFEKEGQIITTLNSDLYADIIKLSDKYSIRLGDGKFFVASDDIKVTFRDPSETPSWATWFMGAVPLASIPDRATLFFIPPEEREKHFPKQLEDNPIICHASLWKLGDQTGVLLHTSWCHIAASYRWKINKPFEIASIMFRSASHPAHIARNFGYAPQLVVPGNEWF